jgi:hypothetical protein
MSGHSDIHQGGEGAARSLPCTGEPAVSAIAKVMTAKQVAPDLVVVAILAQPIQVVDFYKVPKGKTSC